MFSWNGRSRISMIWVPRSGLIHNAEVSCYPYNMNLPPVSTEKIFLQKL